MRGSGLGVVVCALTLVAARSASADDAPPAPTEPATPVVEPAPPPPPPPEWPAPPPPARPSPASSAEIPPRTEAPPSSDPPAALRRFGDRGQVLITDSFRVDGGTRRYDGSSVSTSWLTVAPSAHWFPVDRVSVGLQPRFGYTYAKTLTDDGYQTAREWSLGGSVIVGLAVPLVDEISVWPRATLSIDASTRVGRHSAEDGAITPSLDLFVPVLVHPTGSNLFFGVGPRAGHRFAHVEEGAGPEQTWVGLDSVVGLVLDPAAAPEEPAPVLGADGQLLVTSEIGGVASYQVDSSSRIELGRIRLGGGADYVLWSRFTVGGAVHVAYDEMTDHAYELPQTAPLDYTQKYWTFDAALRGGYLLPLGSRFAVFPRVSVGAELTDNRRGTSGSGVAWTTQALHVGADVPLLLTARRGFLGVVPGVTRDLARRENTQTGKSRLDVGASFLLGGWL